MENHNIGLFVPRGSYALALLLVICLLVPANSIGQTKMKASTAESMQKAMSYYQSARYDDAISLLTKLATDTTVSKKDRKDVFLYLGRAYTAKNLFDKAKWAMAKLLDLEPPLIEPDPDGTVRRPCSWLPSCLPPAGPLAEVRFASRIRGRPAFPSL